MWTVAPNMGASLGTGGERNAFRCGMTAPTHGLAPRILVSALYWLMMGIILLCWYCAPVYPAPGKRWCRSRGLHRRSMLTFLSRLAEFERKLIRPRIGEGRERAKATQFLQPERISLRHAGPVVLGAERRDGSGLVEPHVGIKLLRQGCIGGVAHQ